jgi:sulfite exporter TauE/SafE/copper chaperone CopZ
MIKKSVPIRGMHCKSCEKLVGDELRALPGVRSVRVSLRTKTAVISADTAPDDIAIAAALRRAGYAVGRDDLPLVSHDARDYKIAAVGVIAAVVLLWLLSLAGSGSGISADATDNVLWALVIGLAAGVSTCMALVGGLVAGLSAKHEAAFPGATRWQNFQPHLLFNFGRVVGFALLGGAIGWLGSALVFSPVALGMLTIMAGLFMLIIGLQLTGLFPRLTTLTLPSRLAEKLGLDKQKSRGYSPSRTVLLGVLTFFLPCGFTQAMQLVAVASGSAATGALVMGLFALGTTPGLLAIGGLASLIRGRRATTILKIVGVVVAALALSSIINGANLAGLKWPTPAAKSETNSAQVDNATNVIKATFLGGTKFDKTELRVKAGASHNLEITAEKSGAGCMSAIFLPELSNAAPQLLQKGKTITIGFQAKTAGQYELVCAMGVPFNLKVVVE